MKTIEVIVKKEKNWEGNQYLTYSTEKHGQIAELDYPSNDRKAVRVYAENVDNGYVTFSCMRAGLVGAETACELYLLDNGNYRPVFKYPEGFKKSDFKWKRNYVPVACRIPSKESMIEFIEKIAKDCGQVGLDSACGKYFNVLYYEDGTLVESFEKNDTYGFTKLSRMSYRNLKKIYDNIKDAN